MPRTFEVRHVEDIVNGAVSWITGTSPEPTDWLVGSRARTLVESFGISIEELYYQMYRGLLDHLPLALFDTFAFAALAARPASGVLTFSRLTAAGSDIPIPLGTRVSTIGSASDPARTYKTIAAATLLTGQTSISGVPAEAEATGPAGNVAANQILAIIGSLPNIDAVTNPAAFSGGRNEETLEERKQRFVDYLATLHRGTPLALRLAAEAVAGVASATVVDSPWLYVFTHDSDPTGPGVFTDNSVPGNDPSDAAFAAYPAVPANGDALYVGADIRFDLLRVHVRLPGQFIGEPGVWEYWNEKIEEVDVCEPDDVTGVLGEWLPIPNVADQSVGLSQYGPVSWSFASVPDWGKAAVNGQIAYWVRYRTTTVDAISLQAELHHLVAAPDPGFVYVYAHEGGGTLSASKQTEVANAVGDKRAAGIKVSVRAPVIKVQNVSCVLLIHRGASRSALRTLATQAITQFFGRLRIGQALSLEDLSRVIMNVSDQLADIQWMLPPERDVAASPEQLIRLGSLSVE